MSVGAMVGYALSRPRTGARHLARRVLCHALGGEVRAQRLGREFTLDVVAALPRDGFRLPPSDTLAWVETDNGDGAG